MTTDERTTERARIYPKATAPVTWAVLRAANARAERWRQRHAEARAESDRLRALLDEHVCPPGVNNGE